MVTEYQGLNKHTSARKTKKVQKFLNYVTRHNFTLPAQGYWKATNKKMPKWMAYGDCHVHTVIYFFNYNAPNSPYLSYLETHVAQKSEMLIS